MPMFRHRLLSISLLALLPCTASIAGPSPVSRAFQVQATIDYGCAFGTSTLINSNTYDLGTLSFGTLSNLASPVNVASSSRAGSIVLTCTPGMTVSVALDYGVNGGSSSQRYLKLVSGNETLAYQLYQDAAYSQIWGNGALARTIANFPASPQTYTVYARLFAVGSLPSAGNYRDTVTVTLSF
ncbi:spore coat U domain-containing protein [Pseudomonas aeruginosa]|uniref:Csu type fimbrial protein n=1 Tax=Pseudomonas aeruginosa TaxID=287 RepID=UPI000377E57B|nr:spore coat U domain-containing protein [Pseudomonas aeruginosa]MDI3944279.1 spore coat U domain-containing protein [Pseudomonas aeruginosa]MDI3993653.1 spore coat U domain-containing protein [Pseudomonas aeruginosa]QEF80385.1 SCPU domain-containing protein [Pseudomonas aeruginosa]QEF86389.1 SCPU domain-containing protein [Pseudomonas aeruginosa]QEF92403.1 SCPU domain-containing protein [Pseudomonas aeruginosa]